MENGGPDVDDRSDIAPESPPSKETKLPAPMDVVETPEKVSTVSQAPSVATIHETDEKLEMQPEKIEPREEMGDLPKKGGKKGGKVVRDRKGKPKTPRSLSLKSKWPKMKDIDEDVEGECKFILVRLVLTYPKRSIEEGRKAIKLFLKDGTPIPDSIRRDIRMCDELLPEAATTTRKLALHILTSNRDNLQCLYHSGGGKEYRLEGEEEGRPHQVTSIFAQAVKNEEKGDGVQPEPGLMHCGCDIETALWDFFFFKTWTVSTRDKTHCEGMMNVTRFKPRDREFVVQGYTLATGLHIDDIYTTHLADWYDASNHRRLLLVQIAKLIKQCRKATEIAGASWQETGDILVSLLNGQAKGLSVKSVGDEDDGERFEIALVANDGGE
jgi:hypothetical protein